MMLEQGEMRILQYKILDMRSSNFKDTAETVSGISAEGIGKLGLPVPGASLQCFSEKEYIGQLTLKRSIFLSNQI